MKKTVAVIVAFIMIFTMVCSASEDIVVTINGNKVEFDAMPFVENDRVLVPVRAVAETIGASVLWDDELQIIGIVKGQKNVVMRVGYYDVIKYEGNNFDQFINVLVPSNQAEIIDSEVVPTVIDGRTYVPLRFMSEALGFNVDWDDYTNTAILTCPTVMFNKMANDMSFYNSLISYYKNGPQPQLEPKVNYDIVYKFPKSTNSNELLRLVNTRIEELGFRTGTVIKHEDYTMDVYISANEDDDIDSIARTIGARAAVSFKDSKNTTVLEDSDVMYAEPVSDGVQLYLTELGRIKFKEATKRLSKLTDKNYISIMIDDTVIAAPTVDSEIDSDTVVITGMEPNQASYIATLINMTPLNCELDVVEIYTR